MGLTRRVNRGAILLDDKCPGWADRLRVVLDENPSAFQVAGIGACILGRLFGEYWRGLVALGLTAEDDDLLLTRVTPWWDQDLVCPVGYRYGFDVARPRGAHITNFVKTEVEQTRFKADQTHLKTLWIAAVEARTKGDQWD